MTSALKKPRHLMAAFAVLGLAACQSPEERAAREQERAAAQQLHGAVLAAHIVRAHERCDMTAANPDGYDARLYRAVADVSTQTLAQLHAAGTTFCLDDRIAAANAQSHGRNFRALFYRASNTIALSDDDFSKTGIINKFAHQRAQGTLQEGDILAAVRVRSGQQRRSRWRSEARYDYVAERLNAFPALCQAPLAPVGAPRPAA